MSMEPAPAQPRVPTLARTPAPVPAPAPRPQLLSEEQSCEPRPPPASAPPPCGPAPRSAPTRPRLCTCRSSLWRSRVLCGTQLPWSFAPPYYNRVLSLFHRPLLSFSPRDRNPPSISSPDSTFTLSGACSFSSSHSDFPASILLLLLLVFEHLFFGFSFLFSFWLLLLLWFLFLTCPSLTQPCSYSNHRRRFSPCVCGRRG